MESDGESVTEHCCKVGRVLERYELEGFGERLERKWTGERGESTSLRELQRIVNRRLVQERLVDAGHPPIDGEAENFRRILSADDVSESRRIDARRRLEGEGIDVDALLSDFVSHQTIYNHLRQCRDVDGPSEKSDQQRLSETKSRIFGLQNRTELVTEQSLSQLESHDVLSPEFDVIVDIQAVCENCGRSHDIESVLSRSGCDCEE